MKKKIEQNYSKILEINLSQPIRAVLFTGEEDSRYNIVAMTGGRNGDAILWNAPTWTGGVIKTDKGLKEFKPGDYVCELAANRYSVMSKADFEEMYMVPN